MAAWFYTDETAKQCGPLEEEAVLELSKDGTILSKTLVWKEGMDDWVPFNQVAESFYGSDDDGVPVELGVCAYSERIFPMGELIPYGEALIGPEYKDAFVQELMEVAAVDIEDATEKKLEYVGFWWRTLSSLLDYMIKMIPSWICMVPYYVVAAMGSGISESSSEVLPAWTTGMLLSAGLGSLGMLAISIFYETWMIGKYQATLGKMVIGAKVVSADGSRLTYGRAFGRWLAKKPLNYIIVMGIPYFVFFLFLFGMGALSSGGSSDNSAGIALAILAGFGIFLFTMVLCGGVYWMAAFDKEKRTLHDRIASTRVIKK